MTPVPQMFSPQFFKESLSNVGIVVFGRVIFSLELFPSSVPGLMSVRFLDSILQDRGFLILQTVLVDSWGQCKDADVLLESPSAMAGVHIAEALRMLLPYGNCVSRTLIFLQTYHISGPSPCPGQSMFPHYEWSIREPNIWSTGLANSLMLSWVRRLSRPHLTLRRACYLRFLAVRVIDAQSLGMSFSTTFFGPPRRPRSIVGVKTPWE